MRKSLVPFYIAGGGLAVWAVVVSVIGFTRPDFPATQRQRSTVMGLTLLAGRGRDVHGRRHLRLIRRATPAPGFRN